MIKQSHCGLSISNGTLGYVRQHVLVIRLYIDRSRAQGLNLSVRRLYAGSLTEEYLSKYNYILVERLILSIKCNHSPNQPILLYQYAKLTINLGMAHVLALCSSSSANIVQITSRSGSIIQSLEHMLSCYGQWCSCMVDYKAMRGRF